MFSFAGTQQTQPQGSSSNARFQPASQSLNKNADGMVVSINMSSADINKSRFESRLEWVRNGRQMKQGAIGYGATGMYPASNPTFGVPSNPQSAGQGGPFNQPSGGLFGTQPPQQLGGPMANPLQPPQFSLSGGTQPQNNQGGLFSTLSGPSPQGGLFQQAPVGNFLGVQSTPQLGGFPNLGQQGQLVPQTPQAGLFQPQGNQLGLMPLGQMQLNQLGQPGQQQPICYVIQAPSQSDVSVSFSVDQDALEQEYQREVDEHFQNNCQPLYSQTSTQPQKYNINIRKNNTNKLGINFNNRKPQTNLPSYSQTQGTSSQLLRNTNQFLVNRSEANHEQRLLTTSSRSKIAFNRSKENQFYVACQSTRLKRSLISLRQIDIDEDQLQLYTVQNLLENITQIILKDTETEYCATYDNSERQDAFQMLQGDIPLNSLIFNLNTTISLIPTKRSSLSSQISQGQAKRVKNPNSPSLVYGILKITPTIQELQFMNDQQLSMVSNFVVQNQFGRIEFLEPVDLRRTDIDRLILIEQDSVDFYPEEQGFKKPELGVGINVPIRITFFNFGTSIKGMNKLKEEDFDTFAEKVKKWTEDWNMVLEDLDVDKLVVRLESV